MHEAERLETWRTLGHQPGVSAWFAVWLLARLSRVPRLDGDQCAA